MKWSLFNEQGVLKLEVDLIVVCHRCRENRPSDTQLRKTRHLQSPIQTGLSDEWKWDWFWRGHRMSSVYCAIERICYVLPSLIPVDPSLLALKLADNQSWCRNLAGSWKKEGEEERDRWKHRRKNKRWWGWEDPTEDMWWGRKGRIQKRQGIW